MARIQISFEEDGKEIYRLRFLGTDFITTVIGTIMNKGLADQVETELGDTLITLLDDFDYNELLKYVSNIENEGSYYEAGLANEALNYYENAIFEEARKL